MTLDRFKIVTILTLISFILNLIGLVSPYWIQKKYGSGNKFSNVGLWEICWDGFVHKTYFRQVFYGCFFIYYYKFEKFQSWITPGWFVGIQFIYTIGFLCQWFAGMTCICQCLQLIHRTSRPAIKAFIVSHILSGISIAISTIAFGVQSADKDWMPQPDSNALSFAFASALISFCFSIAAVVISIQRLMHIPTTAASSQSNYQAQSEYGGNTTYAPTYIPPMSVKASSMRS